MAVTSGGGGLDPDFLANFNPANYRPMGIPSPDGGASPIGPAPGGPGPAMPLNFGGIGGFGGDLRGFGGGLFDGVTPGPGGGVTPGPGGFGGGPAAPIGPYPGAGPAAPIGPYPGAPPVGRMTPGMPAGPFANLVGQKVLERLMGIQGVNPGVIGSGGGNVIGSPGVTGSGGYGDAIGLSQAIARLLAMLNR